MPASRIGHPAAFFTPEHQWVLGKVSAYNQKTDTYSCTATDPVFVAVDNLPNDSSKLWLPQDNSLSQDVNDLLRLTELHEASLLFCLKKRYLRDVVYTNIGPIVVAINPFNYSIPWYAESKMDDYLSEDIVIERNLPHSWATAHNAYWEMREAGQNQTILISGESGAGKTEVAKTVLKYLGALSAKNGMTIEDRESFARVNKRVLSASPILESFGNAKTLRNDNSSRFGKFLRVQIDTNGVLVGCHVTKYLLEKSRIITAAAQERVYHSYYQLAHGPMAKTFSLRNPKVYCLLSAGGCIDIDGVDDAMGYFTTKQAMDDVGITEEEQMSVWRLVAGILFLQNVNFVESEESTGSVARVDPNLLPALGRVCELWGVDEEVFKRELTSIVITVQKEKTVRPLNKVKALDMRDSICKSLYDWLFDWLVKKINETTNCEYKSAFWIGLLDIFGFENFQTNSFEQLCINLSNEVLQSHYNQHIFTLDMQECQNEGIDTTHVGFSDNKECIELLMGKIGIFTLLDEECAVSGTEANYLHKLVEKFGPTKSNGGSNYFQQASRRAVSTHFIIRHYASDVQYTVKGMLDKNRDTTRETMKSMFKESKLALIPTILPEEKAKTSSKTTVGGYFIKQLEELMSIINSTNPHWIRCIKPNTTRKVRHFCDSLVMHQLRSAGVLETVRIRKAGYPIRLAYTEVSQRYRVLFYGKQLQGKEACQWILQRCNISDAEAQLGKTKVFMKHTAFVALNHAREEATLQFVAIFQTVGRGSLSRRQVFSDYVLLHRQRIMEERRHREMERKKQQELEENIRIAELAEKERNELLARDRLHRAVVCIQRLVRGFLARKRFIAIYLSTLRAREEHFRDDEQRKYRAYGESVYRKLVALQSPMGDRKLSQQDNHSTSNRRELLRNRRERTMFHLNEKRLFREAHVEEEIALARTHQTRRVAAERRQKEKELSNSAFQREKRQSSNLLKRCAESRFFDEMLAKLKDQVGDSVKNTLNYRFPEKAHRRHEDPVFNVAREHWGRKEQWIDERERLVGKGYELNSMVLTPQERRLEKQYRIGMISRVLQKSEVQKAVLSFNQQWELRSKVDENS